ncbi:MAG TPA: NAD(P)H-dependent oxidoreductase [Polyangiaceae bacterium]|nr:NAD(P)H-dependent oxidoreductase [Polyangiaceae bacterium]
MRILGICGSLQARSANRVLLESARRLAPAGVEVQLYDALGTLPHFNPDWPSEDQPAVMALREHLANSLGVLIASPEYGFSLPGALKNAIDWLIGSGELERKVVAITAAVPVAERGRMGLQALKQTLGAVSARIVWDEPIARGADFEPKLADLMGRLVQAARDEAPPL